MTRRSPATLAALAAVLIASAAPAQERGAQARAQPGIDRIIGGVPVATPAEGAWAVVLLRDGNFHCGGSLVAPEAPSVDGQPVTWGRGKEDPRWVVTAAHRLYDRTGRRLEAEELSVRTGTLDRINEDRRGEDVAVRYVMEHEAYDDRTLANDVALLYLAQPENIDGRQRSSIGLPEGNEVDWGYAAYTQMHVQGWGATAETPDNKSASSRMLLEVRVPVVDARTCELSYAARGRLLAPGMICAGYSRGQFDSCQGDSGGPLIYRPARNNSAANTFLAGVVSWGIGCAQPNLAGVYSSISHFRPWLEAAFLNCDRDVGPEACTRRARLDGASPSGIRSNMITGILDLRPDGCEEQGLCRLGAPLRFVQADGTAWETDTWSSDAVQSGTTDGASIPVWARPFIGMPFDRSYLKAAILHDHYTYRENHVRSWQRTHRMFRDALLASGVDPANAQVMYYAVLIGGPRWRTLVPGEPCPGNCVKTVSRVGTGQGEDWEDDAYDAEAFVGALRDFEEEVGEAILTDDALVDRADATRAQLRGG